MKSADSYMLYVDIFNFVPKIYKIYGCVERLWEDRRRQKGLKIKGGYQLFVYADDFSNLKKDK
jgi:hypothetical protein